jgi:hypothetical protein
MLLRRGNTLAVSRKPGSLRIRLACCALLFWSVCSYIARAELPPDSTWKANAAIADLQFHTDVSLGAAQGVSYRERKLYFYGDVYAAKPRVGIIREYTLDMQPTGRDIQLSRAGKPLICHPTGLCWDKRFGCFIGDTVNKVGHIYQLDWNKALADGNLDHAVLAEILDDTATNGCRPEYVSLGNRRLLATADYGDVHPEVRLYDPALLVSLHHSAAPGVCVYRFASGPFNQNLFWNASAGELTCVQNVVAGLGWKLDVFHLQTAIDKQSLDKARRRTFIFKPHSELEGYLRQPDGRDLFVTSSPRNNLFTGKIQTVAEFVTPNGTWSFGERDSPWPVRAK